MIGQYFAAVQLACGALATPIACCAFCDALEGTSAEVWVGVRFELLAMAAVLPLVGADLRRQWSPEVIAFDAWFCSCKVRWRFRRLEARAWYPRGPNEMCSRTLDTFGHSIGVVSVVLHDFAKASRSVILKRWACWETWIGGGPCWSDGCRSKVS